MYLTLKFNDKKYKDDYYLLVIDTITNKYFIEGSDGKTIMVSQHDLYDMIQSFFYNGDKEDL
jgi:hypothetical protein